MPSASVEYRDGNATADGGLAEPVSALAWQQMGDSALARRQTQLAFECFVRSAELDPQNAEVFFKLGMSLYENAHLEDAIKVLRVAHDLAPENSAVIANLGIILCDTEAISEAEAHLRAALALETDLIPAIRALARLLRDRGNFTEALILWERIICLRPQDAEAHYNKVMDPSYTIDDGHASNVLSAYQASRDPQEKSLLGFSLFRIEEMRDDTAKSVRYLHEANKIVHDDLQYDFERDLSILPLMKSYFDAGFFSTVATGQRQTNTRTPIFIVGMPRSGTTLAEQILSSHPAVHGAGELNVVTDLVRRFLLDESSAKLSLKGFTPGCPAAEQMRLAYLAAIAPLGADRPFVTDKMPLNFRWIGVIKAMFPGAKFVHCTRAPLETCVSIYANAFAVGGNRYANDLGDIARYYIEYVRLMAHWQDMLPEDVLQFDLAALKRDQRGETEKVLGFCGLDWDDRCLDFSANKRAVKTLTVRRIRQNLDRSVDQRTERLRPYFAQLTETLAAAGIDPDHHWQS